MSFRVSMIISDSHKFVFHHVPKTGGSSITAALAPYSRNYAGVVPEETDGWQFAFHHPHYMHHRVKNIVPRPSTTYEATDIPESYYSFAFVRNPFDAVVSAYNHNPTKYKHFDEYVKVQIFSSIEFVARNTQFVYLSDDAGNILVDFVGRYEKLAEDFYEVMGIIGIPLMILPKRKISQNKVYDNYREYYSSVSRGLVETKYKKDLELFGYEF